MTDTKTDAKTTDKEVKELPDLANISAQDWFKTAYDAHTSDEYRSLLDEKNVAYLASDNKTALTYRYLEATKGLQNDSKSEPVTDAPTDVAKNENPATDTTPAKDQEVKQPVSPVTETKVNDQSETKVAPVKPAETKPPVKTESKTEPKAEAISVKSKLGRDVLEPATGTRLIAGKTTKITPTVKASRERILSNLKQLNALNGTQLSFDE